MMTFTRPCTKFCEPIKPALPRRQFSAGRWALALCLATTCVAVWAMPVCAQEGRVDFNREIRPILADHCFHCHGPDAKQRQGGLRFDTKTGLLDGVGESGHRAVVAGDLEKSELWRRVSSHNADERMPPAEGRPLSAAQIERLKKWIASGATYRDHWAFVPPERPAPPTTAKHEAWVRNPIDRFVASRLEQEGLAPAPEADRSTLIRRVTLDITGLPPTLAEVDAFLADTRADAYERVVDRLLASPRYGERQASRWLEYARYADTSGYQSDGERDMWRWRDWVIDAFNANMPFDQFTVEQMAGDLLPGATLSQKIATGFHRNHRGNGEGGIIPEEYAVEYVVDRVETTATVWLALTFACARCHDHKYDPFSQTDFYRLYAFFNNVPEKGRAVKLGNSPPFIKAPTPAQQTKRESLARRVEEAREAFDAVGKGRAAMVRFGAWRQQLAKSAEPVDYAPRRGLEFVAPFEQSPLQAASAPAWVMHEKGTVRHTRGRIGDGLSFDGAGVIEVPDVGAFGFLDKFSLSLWVKPATSNAGTLVSRMTDADEADGYGLRLVKGRLQFNLVKRWLDDSLRVEAARPVPVDEWTHIVATYDGSRGASGIRFFFNGEPVHVVTVLDELNQSFDTKEPFRIGGGNGPQGRFRGDIDEVRVFKRVLEPDDARALAVTEPVSTLAARVDKPAAQKPGAEKPEPALDSPASTKLWRAYIDELGPQDVRKAWHDWQDRLADLSAYEEALPTVMVMEEMPQPRATHILLRGEYNKPGARVTAGTPTVFPPLPDTAAVNRLALARWLVRPEHPLTARVAVNRMWQQHFGVPLVKTTEDFGTQGEPPSHPELLDWLAVEFREGVPAEGSSGASPRRAWDMQRLHRLMVTSAAYRQSSKATPALVQRDLENRLLARGPRIRLAADALRDQGLAVSGLLVEKVGGPSVRPYQPAGLWSELTAGADYVPDQGEGLYRRSLYTYWKRTIAPPLMMTFDASARETCVVRETRTNTPLQALALLNDVTFVEIARKFAERIVTEGGPDDRGRLTWAFRSLTARPPTDAELRVLQQGLARHRTRYRTDPAAARRLLQVGDSKANDKLDPLDIAPFTAIASLLLNLDETITLH